MPKVVKGLPTLAKIEEAQRGVEEYFSSDTPSLTAKVKTKPTKKKRTTPLWEGPDSDGPNGGITFSLLSRFLVCRERFRLLTVEGLKPAEQFSAPLEFGNLWHTCEEALAANKEWETALRIYAIKLLQRFPLKRQEVELWIEKCAALFPIYAEHWSTNPDVKQREPVFQEESFRVEIKLPSGRTVKLRGKFDSVDVIGKGLYIQENKTKSAIDVVKLSRQLTFDLQTMIYVTALHAIREGDSKLKKHPVSGVRYNVIRRSAHKSVRSMLEKLDEDRKAGRIGEWFSRWSIGVNESDTRKFRRECLDPILEQLCDWWGHITSGGDPFESESLQHECPEVFRHWRHPFGVYNVLDEGGATDVDSYLATGSTAGLCEATTLFPEL